MVDNDCRAIEAEPLMSEPLLPSAKYVGPREKPADTNSRISILAGHPAEILLNRMDKDDIQIGTTA